MSFISWSYSFITLSSGFPSLFILSTTSRYNLSFSNSGCPDDFLRISLTSSLPTLSVITSRSLARISFTFFSSCISLSWDAAISSISLDINSFSTDISWFLFSKSVSYSFKTSATVDSFSLSIIATAFKETASLLSPVPHLANAVSCFENSMPTFFSSKVCSFIFLVKREISSSYSEIFSIKDFVSGSSVARSLIAPNLASSFSYFSMTSARDLLSSFIILTALIDVGLSSLHVLVISFTKGSPIFSVNIRRLNSESFFSFISFWILSSYSETRLVTVFPSTSSLIATALRVLFSLVSFMRSSSYSIKTAKSCLPCNAITLSASKEQLPIGSLPWGRVRMSVARLSPILAINVDNLFSFSLLVSLRQWISSSYWDITSRADCPSFSLLSKASIAPFSLFNLSKSSS